MPELNCDIPTRNKPGPKDKYKNLVGKILGVFEVLELEKDNKISLSKIYKCRCTTCGKHVSRRAHRLVYKPNKTCCSYRGAVQDRRASRKYEDGVYNIHYGKHRYSGESVGHGHLAFEEWMEIVTKPCHYCGDHDVRTIPIGTRRLEFFTEEEKSRYFVKINGVDRMDSNGNYTPDNCVSCCKICNRMKYTLPHKEFLAKCKRITELHGDSK